MTATELGVNGPFPCTQDNLSVDPCGGLIIYFNILKHYIIKSLGIVPGISNLLLFFPYKRTGLCQVGLWRVSHRTSLHPSLFLCFSRSLWLPYSAFFLFFPMCSQLPVCSHTPWPCFPLDKSLSTQSGILQTQDSSVSAPVDPMLGEESSDSLENDRVSVSNSTPVFRPTHNTNLHVHFPSILELFRALW